MMPIKNDYSMSLRAAEAREGGKFPASEIARKIGRGATSAGVRAVFGGDDGEWHHTSARYNCTSFYALEDALEHADEIVTESKKLRTEKAAEVKIKEAGRWLIEQWDGSRRFPVRRIDFLEGEIERRGDWIVFSDGRKKRQDKVKPCPPDADISSGASRLRAWNLK